MEEEKNNGTSTKKNKNWLVIILAIIVIAALAGVAYYFMRSAATPKDVFVGAIDSVFESSSKKLGEDVKKLNTTVAISGNIESSNEQISKIAQYINQGKLTYNIQLDTEAKKALINLGVDYQNENLLNGKIYYANGDENIYIYVQDLFDKYFKFNLKETMGEEASTIENMFNGNATTPYGKIDTKKVASIIKETLSKNLKDEYFTKETVDGLTKNTMKLTIGEFKSVIKTIITELKNNEEFLNCFEKKDEVKEFLEDALEGSDEADTEIDNKNIEISIYTKGPKFDLEKVEIIADTTKQQQFIMTVVETEKEKYEINANIPEVGKVKLNLEVKEEALTEIENVNVSDSFDIKNMTQADQIKILSNLMSMKIYQYIAPFLQ